MRDEAFASEREQPAKAAAPEAVERVRENAVGFARLEALAASRLAAGDMRSTAAYAQAAAWFAWLNHPGQFASMELEAILRTVAGSIREVARPAPGKPFTLHVASQLYQTGGSTRALVRWTAQSRDRRHVLCVTQQGGSKIPPIVAGCLGDRVSLMRLDHDGAGLLRRAARLRALARHAELVVLHVHPHDVVPLLAFGVPDTGRPPVMLVDHADHVFWLGTSIVDRLLSMRRSGADLAIRRRGVAPERIEPVLRPLEVARRTMGQAEAKRRLGVRSDQVLFVTAADPAKFRSAGDGSFLDIVEPALEGLPHAILRAAGPAPHESTWAAADARSGGRIRALGSLDDVSGLFEAADVYLDSFPFASLTSLLEAGGYGVPLITYRGHPVGCEVLGSDTPGIDDVMLAPRTRGELVDTVARVTGDGALRREIGERTGARVRDVHDPDRWRASVERLYTLGPVGPAAALAPTSRLDPVDRLVAEVMSRSNFKATWAEAVGDQMPLAGTFERIRRWQALRGVGGRAPLRRLAPDGLLTARGRLLW